MRIVEVREPGTVLDTLENVRESLTAIFREMCAGTEGHTMEDIMKTNRKLDELIETQFVVEDVE